MQLSSLISSHLPTLASATIPLAILPGEGIGPEIIAACRPIFAAIEKHTPYTFDIEYGGTIGKTAYDESGSALTEDVVAFCRHSFARGAPLFCGPGGHRFVYELRKLFDIYCKFVPLRPLPALHDTGVLRPCAVKATDILLVRENAGGLYQGTWHTERNASSVRAHQSFSYDEQQVSRIISLAVAAAERRRGSLCVVHKPGGTPAISELWVRVAKQCTASSQVDLRFLEVDTAAYLVIAESRTFDVVVTPNMFGDVIADAAAVLLGSRGMSYSFNMGENGIAVYQTGHGSACDLAGTQTANPLGQIQSFAALLNESFGLNDLSQTLLAACNEVLASGLRTADIMGPDSTLVSTTDMGAAVAATFSHHLAAQQQLLSVAQTR